MLQKSQPKMPAAGELQHRVDQLSELLAPPQLSDDAMVAQRAFFESTKRVEAARNAFAAAARAHPSHPGYGPTPEVYAAKQTVEWEERQREKSRCAIGPAREKVDRAFVREIMPQIEMAAPTLLDIAQLLHEAMAPLVDLQSFAFRNGLALPRLLAAAPAMQESVRVLTRLLNDATAPRPAASVDND